ncbi:hypothetical protein BKA83DRAFT_102685 [Pisolithus microcarpus]|nr:hypothetical protein BKA83DRAFT_102685 [Pisolithus microcarpus]
MSLFLCVDCGGSKTSAVICDVNGDIVGRGLGGPSNFSYIPLTAFIEAVRVAVSSALSSCVTITPITLPPSTELFVSAWFGIAAPLRLHPDIPHAITAIAGTGSEPSGKLVELSRTGGWGWLLGDEGSGYHVGREAIRQIMLDVSRASLGMSLSHKSTLKRKILSHFGIKKNVSHKLTPLVFDAAFKDNDEFALRVLRNCCRGVVATEAILCFGGSLVGVEGYRALVLDELRKRGCVFRHVEFVDDAAAAGAAGLATMTAA